MGRPTSQIGRQFYDEVGQWRRDRREVLRNLEICNERMKQVLDHDKKLNIMMDQLQALERRINQLEIVADAVQLAKDPFRRILYSDPDD